MKIKCKKKVYISINEISFSVYNKSKVREGASKMEFDELFEKRSLVASKLKDCIRDKGYTKVSFAAKADISRPTLDKLLNGSIDNKSSFDRHLQKILKLLNMTVEELMLYHSMPTKNDTMTVYSQNAPMNHKMNDTAKKQYELLLDVIDLCAIYY